MRHSYSHALIIDEGMFEHEKLDWNSYFEEPHSYANADKKKGIFIKNAPDLVKNYQRQIRNYRLLISDIEYSQENGYTPEQIFEIINKNSYNKNEFRAGLTEMHECFYFNDEDEYLDAYYNIWIPHMLKSMDGK